MDCSGPGQALQRHKAGGVWGEAASHHAESTISGHFACASEGDVLGSVYQREFLISGGTCCWRS